MFFPLFSCFFSSLITGITNNSGVASVTVTGLTNDTLFTCSYGGVSDTVTVTVPASLIPTTLTSINIMDVDLNVGWVVQLKDENNTGLASKTVKLYIDNVLKTTGTTNSAGIVNLNTITTAGTHTLKAVFEGDDTYRSSEVSRTATYEDPFGGIE